MKKSVNTSSSYLLNHSVIEIQVEKGLEFILSHLGKPYWPRTISTKLTEGRQVPRLEALSYFKDSNYLRLGHIPDSCFVSIMN